MSKVLKGNFEVKKPVEPVRKDEDLTARFEREALKRLGGSIAYVRKKKFVAGLEPGPEPEADGKAPPPKRRDG